MLSVEQESSPTEPAVLEEEPLNLPPPEKWLCRPCGRWRYNSWWAVYQHFRKVHPQIPKEEIKNKCEKIN